MGIIDSNDVQLKTVLTAQATETDTPKALKDLLARYSDWHNLQHDVAWLFTFKSNFIQNYHKNHKMADTVVCGKYLTVSELRKAMEAILMLVQDEAFAEDIKAILRMNHVSKASTLLKLSPEGLLRVGGRLKNSDVACEVKHPIILPCKHHVTKIIVRKQQCTHGCQLHTLTAPTEVLDYTQT